MTDIKVMTFPVLALLLAITGCAFNPATGDLDVVTMTEKREIELGKEEHAKVMESMPVYQDKELQDYVSSVGKKLASHSERPELEWHFTIIDSQAINAFALPGGYVYINRGLISYLNSEAQLAAVLSHEIGHVTARHAVRQDSSAKTAGGLSTVAAVVAGVYTGSGAVAQTTHDATAVLGTAVVRGYGREMELQADELGARYLNNSGYNPQAMVEVIGVLKDQENFERLKAKDTGEKYQGYHGLFSTHPRNDQRLKNAVGKAGELKGDAQHAQNNTVFRQKINHLKFSDESLNTATIDNRYYNRRYDFTIAFPSDWKLQTRGSVIQAYTKKDRGLMRLQLMRANKELTPKQFMERELNIVDLIKTESFEEGDLKGYVGKLPGKDGKPDQAKAVIYHRGRAFIFTAKAENPALQSFYDTLFVSSIKSFRPLTEEDRTLALSRKLKYVKTGQSTSFASLASKSPLKEYPEEQLRLLNDYYPSGEPEKGEWIKVVE